MANFIYRVRSKKKPAIIHVRMYQGNKLDVSTPTFLKIDPKNWNDNKKQVKKCLGVDYEFINKKLDELKIHLSNEYNRSYAKGDKLDKDWLSIRVKNFFNRPSDEINEDNYLIYYSDFAKWWLKVHAARYRSTTTKFMDEGTKRQYQNFVEIFTEYEEHIERKIILEHISPDMMDDFASWLQNEQLYAESYVKRQIRRFKFFCERAEELSIPISLRYKSIVFISQETNKDYKDPYLNIDEINSIYNIDYTNDQDMDNVRDNLIIACWTGLRISDFSKLNEKNINDGMLELQTKKTKTKVTIPLHPMVLEILDKRKGKLPKVISSQDFNEKIKFVAKDAGLTEKIKGGKTFVLEKNGEKLLRKKFDEFEKWELVTSHIGRRSFATNLFNKVPNSVIMSVGGWKSERQMLDYIKMTNFDNALELQKTFEKM